MKPWQQIVRSGHFKRKIRKNLLRITTENVKLQVDDAPVKLNSDVNTVPSFQESSTDHGSTSNTVPSFQESSTDHGNTSSLNDECDIDYQSSVESISDVEDLVPEVRNFEFSQNVKEWALKHNIKHNAIRDLLGVLNKHTTVKFPKDARTFLATPSKTNIKDIAGGQYWHNGLRECLQELYQDTDNSHNISIKINIDGLPIFKSSKYEFWPILFNVNEHNTKPMIIGMYYGKGKPSNLNEFLSEFVEEFLVIMNEGVMIGEHKLNVSLKCFICDSPARSFVKGVVNFNSQHGCQKCTIVGEYSHISHTNYYPDKQYPKRTDEHFRQKNDECHHKTDSVLLQLPINMIDCFPVADSLHLIDLGVMKRLLTGWRDGTYKNKLLKWPAKVTEEISKNMLKVKLPQELHRAVRGLDCLSHWKGLEYRHFLLYIGIVILKDVLKPDVYEHFLGLFCAITICSSDYYVVHLHVAEALLVRYVSCYSKIYGEHFITSNIHNLTHLVDDVKNMGNLNNFTAYPFESKLFEIKNMLRSGNNPLAQVARRLIEKQKFEICANKESPIYPLLKYVSDNVHLRTIVEAEDPIIIYKTIFFKEYCLGGSYENKWFLTKQNDIVYMEAAAKVKDEFLICGKKLTNASPFFLTPINSSVLNIYTARIEFKPVEIFMVSCIKCKLVHVGNKDQTVFIPLLHTLSK